MFSTFKFAAVAEVEVLQIFVTEGGLGGKCPCGRGRVYSPNTKKCDLDAASPTPVMALVRACHARDPLSTDGWVI